MLIVATLLSVLIVGLLPIMHRVQLSDPFIRLSSVSLLIPIFLSGAVLLTVRRVPVAAVLVMLLALTQRVADVGTMYPTVPQAAFYHQPAVLNSISANGLYRFVAENYALLPNLAAHYGVEDVRGFQAMSLGRLHDTFPLWCIAQRNWFNRVDSLSSPFLSFLNVRYALHYPERHLPDRWRVIGRAGRLDLVENTAVLPRAFIPTAVRAARSGTIDEMRRTTDFAAITWIDQASGNEQNGFGSVSIARSGFSAYSLHADLLSDSWIVVSQPAWKGWRAFDGGHDIPVSIANHAFLGIHLSRGHHDVALWFRPYSFVVGRMLTIVTLIGMGGFFVWHRFF
jgi:hypothetical protein